ncbi:MAG TPA: DUF4870 domain-containing protein [Candidatus Cybelea sp.]|nr:DUF4870 domain-containing protein [Candidatus Cybelea sp.]
MQVQIAPQERNWAMAAHLSALVAVAGLPFGHIVGPLIVYLIKAHESEFVAEHARASLNYQITISIVGFIGIIVAVGAMFGLLATGSAIRSEATGYAPSLVVLWIIFGGVVALIFLLSLIFIIAGTVAASNGRPYTYPFAIRFLR